MLSKPEVKEIMSRFVIGKLYTDKDAEPMISNRNFQNEEFGTTTLPLYVFYDAEGRKVTQIANSYPYVGVADFMEAFRMALGEE